MKDNQYNKPLTKIYIVQEQPIKQSNLSLAARNKIVNKNQVYQSQNQDSYGPCLTYNPNCECSLEELQRQEQILKNREIEERSQKTKSSYLNFGGLFTNWTTDNSREGNSINQEEYEELIRERDNLRQQVANSVNEQNARENAEQQLNQVQQELQRITTERNEIRENLQTIQQRLTQVQNSLDIRTRERDNAQQERDERINVSIEEYNQLLNKNQELKNQQITEFILDINLGHHDQGFLDNFKEIEKKVKSLEKLLIMFKTSYNYNNNYHAERGEWMQRLQNFIDQNVNLTHLNIRDEGGCLHNSHFFDLTKLTRLKFLSISSPLKVSELDLRQNEDLEVLYLKSFGNLNDYANCTNLTGLNLKQNKKLKCLIFKNVIFYNLDLKENKDLEYVDISEAASGSRLNLRENKKITRLFDKSAQQSSEISSQTYQLKGNWKIGRQSGNVCISRNKNQSAEIGEWIENN